MQEWSQFMDTGTERYLLGDFPGAEKGYRAALEEAKLIFEVDDERYLLNLSLLASVLCLNSNFAAAEPLYHRQLEIREERNEMDTSDLAECLEGYARVLTEIGRPEEAEPLAARARRIREWLSAGHPDDG
ncbi:MAG: tetratricopeptide repeat protein [Nitrospirota bacterium]|jgi:tetratricopeptide (TPR) repeat protein